MKTKVRLLTAVGLGSTTLILLLVCMNVTTLLLSRSASRQREIAIRLSLGAGRARLLRQLLTESLVSSCAAAGLALALAFRAPAWLWQIATQTPPPFRLQPDGSVLAYCLATALIVGILAGLSPALQTLRAHTSDSLKAGSLTATASHGHVRMRNALVALQVTLSVVLVTQAALFARVQQRFYDGNPGFETRTVLNVTLSSVLSGIQPPLSFYRQLENRVAALPGVRKVSYASPAPWSGRSSAEIQEIDGAPVPRTGDVRTDPAMRAVAQGYFNALKVPLLRGRTFISVDGSANRQVKAAVISGSMARRYWPAQDPIGRTFRAGSLYRVEGVCGDTQSIVYPQDDGPFFYTLLEGNQAPYLLIGFNGSPQSSIRAVTEIIHQLDPEMVAGVEPLSRALERQAEKVQPAVAMGLSSGLLALVLALTGVCGLVSLSVDQRVREIGLHQALGAQKRDVILMVTRGAALPIVGGLVAGLGLSIAASKGISSALFGFSLWDPATVVFISILILMFALSAVWIPARRASGLNPLQSLRNE